MAEAADSLDIDCALGQVLFNCSFIIDIFLLLLDVVHAQTQLMQDCFIEDIDDHAVGVG